jgi:hypothetical protein
LTERGDTWHLVKGINGQRYRVSTGFADKKSAERRAVAFEHDIRSGILGWKGTIPRFAEWWTVYRATFTPTKSSKNRDAQIDAKAALKEQLDAEGTLWTQNQRRLRKVLAGGAVRARVAHLTPHTLRHTFGTRRLQADGDSLKLSRILGHSSVAVTEAHYAHLLKDDLVAASQQVKIPVAPRAGANVIPMPARRTEEAS